MNQIDVPTVAFKIDFPLVSCLVAVAMVIAIITLVRRMPAAYRLWTGAAFGISLVLLAMIGVKTNSVTVVDPTTSQAAVNRGEVLNNFGTNSLKPAKTPIIRQPEPIQLAEAPVQESETKEVNRSNSVPIALPDWTQQPTSAIGSTSFAVVRSGRFASREEAEQNAFNEAINVAAKHFRRLDPRGVAAHTDSQRDLVRQTAIRQRHDEVSRHDFGTMKNHPMHQVWLQLELSPTLGDKLAEPWRHSAVEARLRTLTGWAIWLTAAAAALTIALRLDSAWQGQRRRVICFVTVFLIVSSMAWVA